MSIPQYLMRMRERGELTMGKNNTYEQIKADISTNNILELERFKELITYMLPIHGELEVDKHTKENGSQTLIFFDVDETQFVIVPEDVNEVDTRMATRVLTLHLNQHDVVTMVEHGFDDFTLENKEKVYLFNNLLEKKVDFN